MPRPKHPLTDLTKDFNAWLKTYLDNAPMETPKRQKATTSNVEALIFAWRDDIIQDMMYWNENEYLNLKNYVNP